MTETPELSAVQFSLQIISWESMSQSTQTKAFLFCVFAEDVDHRFKSKNLYIIQLRMFFQICTTSEQCDS